MTMIFLINISYSSLSALIRIFVGINDQNLGFGHFKSFWSFAEKNKHDMHTCIVKSGQFYINTAKNRKFLRITDRSFLSKILT